MMNVKMKMVRNLKKTLEIRIWCEKVIERMIIMATDSDKQVNRANRQNTYILK